MSPPKKTTALTSVPPPSAVRVAEKAGVSDEEIARRVTEARRLVFHAGLPDLVANRERINEIVASVISERGAGEVPSDIWDALTLIDDLVAGKVDRVGDLLETVIPAYLDGLKKSYQEQKKHTEAFAERMDDLLKQALKFARSSGRTMVEGMRWRARLQSNSRPAVSIEDETAVPNDYRRRAVTLSFEFNTGDEAMEAYWAAFFAGWEGREGFKGGIANRIDTEAAYGTWKAKPKEQRDQFTVAGIKIDLGEHTRMESGKSKATAKIEPIKIPAPEAAAIEGETK